MSCVEWHADNQVLDAAGGNKIFKLNADLILNLNNFSSGDRVDLVPSFASGDVSIDSGVVGDGQVALLVINDDTTTQVNLTGAASVDRAGVTYNQLESLFGAGFLY